MMVRISLLLFILIVAADLSAIILKNEGMRFVFKPQIIPALALYFLFSTLKTKQYKFLILAALFFSWVGDVLLMFEYRREIYFLGGLSAFLIAHVFYILLFLRMRKTAKIKSNPWLLLLVSVYYTSLILFLSPYLGDKEWPVRIYGVVISLMLLLALHLPSLPNRRAGIHMCTGAVLFVLSDSVLALNKFYYPFEGAGLLVMITYVLAQWFIITGALYMMQKQKV